MLIAVASCWKYRDAWNPFLQLLEHFWPNHPKPVYLLTDEIQDFAFRSKNMPVIFSGPEQSGWPWCRVVSEFAANQEEPLLLFQEDFFLTAPVKDDLVEHALDQMAKYNAVAVRLYPCPGSNRDYGDATFGEVTVDAPYRISCQATIYQPWFLTAIASRFGTAESFEVCGNPFAADAYPDETVLACRRDANPWPLEYICSAISAGRWDPNAKKLCESLGIEADFAMRAMAPS